MQQANTLSNISKDTHRQHSCYLQGNWVAWLVSGKLWLIAREIDLGLSGVYTERKKYTLYTTLANPLERS